MNKFVNRIYVVQVRYTPGEQHIVSVSVPEDNASASHYYGEHLQEAMERAVTAIMQYESEPYDSTEYGIVKLVDKH